MASDPLKSSKPASDSASAGVSSTDPLSSTSPASATPAVKESWMRRRILNGNRLHKWLIVVLALGCVGLYGFHVVATHQLEEEIAAERATLATQANLAVEDQMQASLRVAGLGLSWAATQAMQREDLTSIDAHTARMVKEGPVTLIAVLDSDGVVRVATNKKLEGKAGATAFAGAPLTATDLTVWESGAEMTVVAPLEFTLGTAVLVYDRPSIDRAALGLPPADTDTDTAAAE